jgi:hypothetical protein
MQLTQAQIAQFDRDGYLFSLLGSGVFWNE